MGSTKLARAKRKSSQQPVRAEAQMRSRPFEATEESTEESGLPSHQFGQIAIQPLTPQASSAQATTASSGREHGGATAGVAQVQAANGVDIQPLMDDPARFETMHRNLFTAIPGGDGQAAQPWEADTGDGIIRQFKRGIQTQVDQRPLSVMGEISTRTTENEADRDAVQVNQQIQARFPQITSGMSDQEVQGVVSVLPPGQALDAGFLHQWLANKLVGMTNISTYGVSENDARFQQVVTTLASDQSEFDFSTAFDTLRSDLEQQGMGTGDIMLTLDAQRRQVRGKSWVWVLETLAGRTGAFTDGSRISFSRGMSDDKRRLTLIHELIHFYAHPGYREWVEATSDARFYNEGFTEFLARQVMTEEERSHRNSYQERYEAIVEKVASFAPVDDIAAAYFSGEVWRLECQSAVAQRLFSEQVGLTEGASRSQEKDESRSSAGIVQTVQPGYHYRFMNLGVGEPAPKAEHLAFLERLVREQLQGNASIRIRFVGHASSTGNKSFNANLARQRAMAFDGALQELGVPAEQFFDPEGEQEDESSPTATNDSVFGRAMNRRVELFLVPQDSTRVEDTVRELGRLRGEGIDPNDVSLGRDLNTIQRNAPNPDERLPFTDSGWDGVAILTALGQYDALGRTDSDALRCVQAVAIASHIPQGPDAVSSYLTAIARPIASSPVVTPRQQTALQVLQQVQTRLADRSATFGDMAWAQEAVHDLFFTDAEGTPEPDILNQITPNEDATQQSTAMNVWCNSPTEVMVEANRLNAGEQLIVTAWSVNFNETFHRLEDAGESISDPMQVNINGNVVWIHRINASQRPQPSEIDPNRDTRNGHQLLIMKDATALGTVRLYEPEITESGQHLATLASNGAGLESYFRDMTSIEIYGYIQILGKLTPAAPSAP